MTISYPDALSQNAAYWKYGPLPGPIAAGWYELPATRSVNTVTFSITDGQTGDDDLTPDGTIIDQGGPAVPAEFRPSQRPDWPYSFWPSPWRSVGTAQVSTGSMVYRR